MAATPPAPFFEADGIRIFNGEALGILRDLPAGTFDVVLADPPYSSGGLYRGDRTASVTEKYVSTGTERDYEGGDFTGDNRDQRSWSAWTSAWCYEAMRVTRPGGHLFMFCDWRQLPTATDAVQLGGWLWRSIITWHKPSGGIPQKGRFKMNAEFVVWGTHGSIQDSLSPHIPAAVIEVAGVPAADRVHPTQKPVALLRHLLTVVPARDDGSPLRVLDPFMGSGSTLRAAMDLKLHATGIELDPRFCESARELLGQQVLL